MGVEAVKRLSWCFWCEGVRKVPVYRTVGFAFVHGTNDKTKYTNTKENDQNANSHDDTNNFATQKSQFV